MAKCRSCSNPLTRTFVDLGMHPLSNAYVRPDRLNQMEPFYPLHCLVCERCFLVQIDEYESPAEIFSEYAYFSSFSESWLQHCREYVDQVTGRFGLNGDSQVIEVASNDGYLLQYFKERNIPILGIEPARNVATVAIGRGIPTEIRFFGVETANDLVRRGIKADLLLGNNVLAHVPDINDFVAGMKVVLGERGIITMEFPHLLCLMENNQFDTIYHEHFSYLSFMVVEEVFARHGIRIFDVQELPTHGGSLCVFGCHSDCPGHPVSGRVEKLRQKELDAGLRDIRTYERFAQKAQMSKCDLVEFLVRIKRHGKRVVGYGAAAKGNTLLNYCGIGSDFIEYVVDRNPHKQGCYLPGTHIPICDPGKIKETQPDYIVILPWNIKDEIISQLSYVRQWGGAFVIPIPRLEVMQ